MQIAAYNTRPTRCSITATWGCCLFALAGLAFADDQYKSRPDLAPSKLNITIPAHKDVAPGNILVGPCGSFEGPRGGPEQAAAYIFRDDGDLIWSSFGHCPGFVANFQATKLFGQPVVHAFTGSLDSFH
jgi:hypothetical protein